MLGSIAGIFAGLLGLGGGLIIVPVLAILFAAEGFAEQLVMIMAVATSLATIVFTSISSVAAHHRLGTVVWNKVMILVPGIIIGSVLGAVLADFISAQLLKTLFIIYVLCVAVQMGLEVRPEQVNRRQPAWLDYIAAVVIGMTSSILGIGGGSLTVPYLVHNQYSMRNAVAVASACGLPIAIAGTVSYAVLGQHVELLPQGSLGYVYLPAFLGIVLCSVVTAPIGAKLAHYLPAQKLKRYFALFLIAVAIKMIF